MKNMKNKIYWLKEKRKSYKKNYYKKCNFRQVKIQKINDWKQKASSERKNQVELKRQNTEKRCTVKE